MGRSTSEGIIASGITVDQQLAHHLQYNHYPPITQRMVVPCKLAIDLVAGDEGDTKILVGDEGLANEIPAWQIVEDLHLDPWVESVRFALELDDQEGQA